MRTLVGRVEALALTLGAPGLFLVAFLDSSFLSLPEIADLLVVWMVTRQKARLLLYVVGATLGSIAGCLVLYVIAKKGGEALVRSRFSGPMVDRAMAAVQRNGLLAVLIPSVLPPPAPFKIFVLMAGAADIGVARFAGAIAVGRGARYLAEGLIAVWYGDRALEFLHAHARTVTESLLILIAAAVAGYFVWTRARARKRP